MGRMIETLLARGHPNVLDYTLTKAAYFYKMLVDREALWLKHEVAAIRAAVWADQKEWKKFTTT
jgi:hypothetical protein